MKVLSSMITIPLLWAQLSKCHGKSDDQNSELVDISLSHPPSQPNPFAPLRSLVTKDYIFQQVGSDIDGEARLDRSGYSVAMSDNGKRVIIGAPYNDHDESSWNFIDSGHARIYEEVNSTWIQVGEDIDGWLSYDKLGWSLGMSSDGKRVIVGSAHSDEFTGYVRVFEEKEKTWIKVGEDITGGSSMIYSGYSIDISGNGKRLIIGTIYSNGPGGDKSGHATIYEDIDGQWVQVGSTVDGLANEENCGYDVAISEDGMRVIIGSLNPPFARVFAEEENGNWIQIGENIEGPKVGISANGKRVIAGSKSSCRVYEEDNGKWVEIGNLFRNPPTGVLIWPDYAISADGKSAIMGFPWKGEWGRVTGSALVYQEEDGDWVQVGGDIVGEAANDESGASVSISADGMRVLVGAPYNAGKNGGDSGHARVFELVKTTIKEDGAEGPESSSSSRHDTFHNVAVGMVSTAIVLFLMKD